jgi:hypothetical protein
VSFTCPRCGRTSQNPNDEREGYCGHCHQWTGNDLWRFEVTHDVPADHETILARATLCRTVHGLADHGMLGLVSEYSEPSRFSFSLQAPQDVREGLTVVAVGLGETTDWVVSWWKVAVP